MRLLPAALAALLGAPAAQDPESDSLRWLAKRQKADGSWEAPDAVAATSLSILVFLGGGHSHLSKDAPEGIVYGDVVRKALQWLMARQDPKGRLGNPASARRLQQHAIAAFALTEAYGLTRETLLRDPAQNAIDALSEAQTSGSGWGFAFKDGKPDTRVTGWAVLAFKSAELAGLEFPKAAYDGALAWFDSVTGADGRVRRPDGAADAHETATAIATVSRLLIRKKRDPRGPGTAARLAQDLPSADPAKADPDHAFWTSQALHRLDGPDGAHWKAWSESLRDALLKTRDRGEEAGSWTSTDRWGVEGGRVAVTALHALTFELHTRNLSLLGTR